MIRFWLMMILTVCVSSVCMAQGAGVRFYTGTGKYMGNLSAYGNSSLGYSANGAYLGRTQSSGETTRFYTKSGQYAG